MTIIESINSNQKIVIWFFCNEFPYARCLYIWYMLLAKYSKVNLWMNVCIETYSMTKCSIGMNKFKNVCQIGFPWKNSQKSSFVEMKLKFPTIKKKNKNHNPRSQFSLFLYAWVYVFFFQRKINFRTFFRGTLKLRIFIIRPITIESFLQQQRALLNH